MARRLRSTAHHTNPTGKNVTGSPVRVRDRRRTRAPSVRTAGRPINGFADGPPATLQPAVR